MTETTNPAPGTVWRDKTTSAPPDLRRLVRVDSADTDGFVEGVGWWQGRTRDGRWEDETWSGVRRRTRVRTQLFLRRYERIETEGAAP